MSSKVRKTRGQTSLIPGKTSVKPAAKTSAKVLAKPAPKAKAKNSAASRTSDAIEMSITVKATVGEVWHALTASDELENWWSDDVTLEPKVGGKFQERWEDDRGNKQLASGKVLAVKKMKEIIFTWREKDWPKDANTECVLSIADEGALSVLTMKHTGWKTLPEPMRAKVFKDFKMGWTYHMKELKSYLDA